jgi:predicted transcriptional regulator
MPAPFTARLDASTLEALDSLAEKTDRSGNSLVSRAVEDFVALDAWRLGKIEAGLAAADRGDLYQISKSMTLCLFPNQQRSDSTWRTRQFRHDRYSASERF